jgi:aminoglycoside phosphotransferase (APT) family kinase protein
MKQLYAMGYPVPQVLLLGADGTRFDKPFVIMERIVGRSMGAISDESPVEKKLELLTLFCQMFVDLHALDWRAFAPDTPPYEARDLSTIVGHQLSCWQAYTLSLQNDAFAPVFNWLRERLPDVRFGRPSVIHMDYHPYNILIREDGAPFVIDWTSAQVSDYRLDLAWTLLLMSTYGHPESREIVLGEYERLAGHRVEQIEYFEAAACLRRLFSILVSLGGGAGRLGMRPGAEAMMKNVGHIERVYALLRDRTGITVARVEELLSVLS